ncbi:MAG: glycosyl transferase family 2 [Candidatus Melainabacteria bacterium]|nr:MAG: glycosyl transferase family 2 [Candidatus Melainabacteria bacterium]
MCFNLGMPQAKVSIVIVHWRTPELLMRCLESVYADTHSDEFEVYVVDNASGDNSMDLLKRNFPQVEVRANSENVGFSRACNQVIPGTTGLYVLLLNPDTELKQDAISKLAQFMETHPDCGAVGPKILNQDGSLQLACRRSFPSPAAAFFRLTYLSRIFPQNKTFSRYNLTYADPDKSLAVDALSGSCMMVRRAVIDKIGLLDEDIFMFGEDIDWCWRIKETGSHVYYLPEAVIYHLHGASSRLRPIGATIDLHKGMEVFYRKHLAQKYWAPFNAVVYAAIWTRALCFILINFLRAKLSSHSPVDSSKSLNV